MKKTSEFVPGRSGVVAKSGQFFVDLEVRAQPNDEKTRILRALVDPGSRYSWIPEPVLEDMGIMRRQPVHFATSNGEQISRLAGYACLMAEGVQTMDIVVFGEAGDPTILGTRTLDGLNLLPDAPGKRLVPGGPLPMPAPLTK